MVQPNPEALLRSPGEDEALHMAFAQEIARQVVISYRNEGMTIKEAIRIPAEKWGLKTFLKGLWQGRRPHIKTHLVMRLFTEWLNRYHPDLEPYAQQILTAFYDNRTFQNGPMRTDVAARRWSLKHRAAMREYFMLDGLTAAQADRRMIFV